MNVLAEYAWRRASRARAKAHLFNGDSPMSICMYRERQGTVALPLDQLTEHGQPRLGNVCSFCHVMSGRGVVIIGKKAP